MFVALTMCAASVYQMMRGIIVIITALMAMLFLGKKQYIHHWISLGSIVFGLALVGYAAISSSSSGSGESETKPLGIILLLLSQCFAGTQFIVEEKLLSQYYLDPLKIVGIEGMWGFSIYIVLLIIFQHINCTSALCNYGKLEDSILAFEQLG